MIEAPVKDVWAYLDDPVHLPEIWPSVVEVKDVERLANGGHRFHWLYKMAGMRFEGDSETVEFEPERHFLQKSSGQIPSSFDWTFMPEDGFTKIDLKTEYEVPKSLLGKLTEPFIHKVNEREADTVLANLEDRMEA
jgi:uncharacterized membrane protein